MSKSKIMKSAWTKYRNGICQSFSEALKSAWKNAKIEASAKALLIRTAPISSPMALSNLIIKLDNVRPQSTPPKASYTPVYKTVENRPQPRRKEESIWATNINQPKRIASTASNIVKFP